MVETKKQPLHITVKIVRDKVVDIVGEYGRDYVYKQHYNTCTNFVTNHPDSKPACIVGHVFHSLGLNYTDCGNGSVLGSIATLNRTRPGEFTFSREAYLLLTSMQTIQDMGGSWGSCEDVAHAIYYAQGALRNDSMYPSILPS